MPIFLFDSHKRNECVHDLFWSSPDHLVSVGKDSTMQLHSLRQASEPMRSFANVKAICGTSGSGFGSSSSNINNARDSVNTGAGNAGGSTMSTVKGGSEGGSHLGIQEIISISNKVYRGGQLKLHSLHRYPEMLKSFPKDASQDPDRWRNISRIDFQRISKQQPFRRMNLSFTIEDTRIKFLHWVAVYKSIWEGAYEPPANVNGKGNENENELLFNPDFVLEANEAAMALASGANQTKPAADGSSTSQTKPAADGTTSQGEDDLICPEVGSNRSRDQVQQQNTSPQLSKTNSHVDSQAPTPALSSPPVREPGMSPSPNLSSPPGVSPSPGVVGSPSPVVGPSPGDRGSPNFRGGAPSPLSIQRVQSPIISYPDLTVLGGSQSSLDGSPLMETLNMEGRIGEAIVSELVFPGDGRSKETTSNHGDVPGRDGRDGRSKSRSKGSSNVNDVGTNEDETSAGTATGRKRSKESNRSKDASSKVDPSIDPLTNSFDSQSRHDSSNAQSDLAQSNANTLISVSRFSMDMKVQYPADNSSYQRQGPAVGGDRGDGRGGGDSTSRGDGTRGDSTTRGDGTTRGDSTTRAAGSCSSSTFRNQYLEHVSVKLDWPWPIKNGPLIDRSVSRAEMQGFWRYKIAEWTLWCQKNGFREYRKVFEDEIRPLFYTYKSSRNGNAEQCGPSEDNRLPKDSEKHLNADIGPSADHHLNPPPEESDLNPPEDSDGTSSAVTREGSPFIGVAAPQQHGDITADNSPMELELKIDDLHDSDTSNVNTTTLAGTGASCTVLAGTGGSVTTITGTGGSTTTSVTALKAAAGMQMAGAGGSDPHLCPSPASVSTPVLSVRSPADSNTDSINSESLEGMNLPEQGDVVSNSQTPSGGHNIVADSHSGDASKDKDPRSGKTSSSVVASGVGNFSSSTDPCTSGTGNTLASGLTSQGGNLTSHHGNIRSHGSTGSSSFPSHISDKYHFPYLSQKFLSKEQQTGLTKVIEALEIQNEVALCVILLSLFNLVHLPMYRYKVARWCESIVELLSRLQLCIAKAKFIRQCPVLQIREKSFQSVNVACSYCRTPYLPQKVSYDIACPRCARTKSTCSRCGEEVHLV